MKKRGVGFGRRAQAAIFIIMSLVIIISGLVYFIYNDKISGKEIEVVQPEAQPVKSFVENCMQKTAEEGLSVIGLTGGYAYIPENINNDPRSYLSEGNFFKTPYWWHDGINSMPSEGFINNQLKTYIKTELNSCIENFTAFGSQFEITPLKDPIVDVSFNENDVSISLNYPVEVIGKGGNFKALLEKFSYTSPIRFKKTYGLARAIMERENLDSFFEQKAIDLYSMDSEIPTTDMQASCGTKTWKLTDIKQTMSNLLAANMPYVRIEGTDYNPNLYVPTPNGNSIYSQTYFQNHYVWNVDNDAKKKYSNMKVSFAYDNWPMQMYARPSDNGILKSNSEKGSRMLSFFCLNVWHFTYDMSYPMLATIIDKETPTNKQYQFNFAFKVAIDHNQPNRLNKGATLFDSAETVSNDDYCSDVQNEITIFTVNNATSEDIKDVDLQFACGRYSCDMGKSDWLSLGAAAGITKKMPYCINGVIKGTAPGFIDAQSFMQTDVDGRSYILPMNPVKELDYSVIKHPYTSPASETPFGADEKISIILTAKDTGYETFAIYPKEMDSPLKLPSSKDMSYDVSIYVADGENIKGGYIGQWNVNKDDLENANEAVFHIIDYDAPSEDEMFLFMSGLESYSKNIPAPELR